jgi:hypothetical protein
MMNEYEWVENFVKPLDDRHRRIRAAYGVCDGISTDVLERAGRGGMKKLVEAATNASVIFGLLLTMTEMIAESVGASWEHTGHDIVLDDLAAALAPFKEAQ